MFAAASLMCAFAPSFGLLVAGRTVQGVAGAAIVCAALDLLAETTGSDARAARVWALAGILGAAFGPAAGGILTQLLRWESIFVVQAPLILVTALALIGLQAVPIPQPVGRPNVAANAALLLVSGALVAALFVLVILLINGWRLEPLAAGLVVTVMPLAAIAAARFACVIEPPWARAASGVILIAGGLAALGRRVDGPAAARRRRGARARALGAHRAGARRPLVTGGARRLDDRRTSRRRRARAPAADADLHHRSRAKRERRARRRHVDRPR